MKPLSIDMGYVKDILEKLLIIPSPTGYTDQIVYFVGEELSRLGIPFQMTRRGAIQAELPGDHSPIKASGHTFHEEIDQLPVKWENVEVRVDEVSKSREIWRPWVFT